MITYIRTKDGAQVSAAEALDERGVLKDGHTMRFHWADVFAIATERKPR